MRTLGSLPLPLLQCVPRSAHVQTCCVSAVRSASVLVRCGLRAAARTVGALARLQL